MIQAIPYGRNGITECFVEVSDMCGTWHFWIPKTRQELTVFKDNMETLRFDYAALDLEYYQGVAP